MAEIWGIATAAVVGAGASIYAGGKAADASKDATGASIAEQRRQYDQTRSDFAGQRSIGNSTMDQLARLYGFAPPSQAAALEKQQAPMLVGDTELPAGTTTKSVGDGWYEVHYNGQRIGTLRPGGANGKFINDTGADINALFEQQRQLNQQRTASTATGKPDMGAFFEGPDYQYNLEQSERAINRAQSAGGRFNSGRAGLELTRNASGLASQQFGDFTNRLMTMAGLGNAATSATANAGANAANNNSAAVIANGNNRASAYMTQAAGVNNAVQGGISNYMLSQYLNKPVK